LATFRTLARCLVRLNKMEKWNENASGSYNGCGTFGHKRVCPAAPHSVPIPRLVLPGIPSWDRLRRAIRARQPDKRPSPSPERAIRMGPEAEQQAVQTPTVCPQALQAASRNPRETNERGSTPRPRLNPGPLFDGPF
jgi:hypothetical protein